MPSSPGQAIQACLREVGSPATSEVSSDLLGAVAPRNMKNC
jgi:hypothetical protein